MLKPLQPVAMRQKGFRAIISTLLLACFAAFAFVRPACAADASSNTGLSDAQARQLISVLSNDSQRQQFLTTLQNLVKAQQNTKHTSLLTMARDNLTEFGERALQQLHVLHQNIIDFGAIGPWLGAVLHDAALQKTIAHIALRVLIMLAVSFVLLYSVRLVLRPLRRRINRMAKEHNKKVFQNAARKLRKANADAEGLAQHATDEATSAKTTSSHDDAESVQATLEESLRHQGALTQLMLCLRRAPYALAWAGLELLAIVMFPLVTLLMEVLDPAPTPQSDHALWSITWLVGIGLGLWVILLRIFLAPEAPWLRLSILHDRTANFIFRYLRHIGYIIAWGFAALDVIATMSVPSPVLHGLQKLLILVVHFLLAVMIIRSRGIVRRACQLVGANNRHLQSLMSVIAKGWWIVALFFDGALWLVWAADIAGGYQLILQLFVRTIIALVIVRVVSILIYGGLERFMRALNDWNLNGETLARIRRYYPAATAIIRIIMAVITILALAIAWGAPVYLLMGQNTLGPRIFQAALTILVALIIGVVAWEVANVTIEHHIRRLDAQEGRDTKIRVARLQTLTPMFRILFLLILAVIIGLTVLSQLGIDTGPLIASASIFGVALGFGSQKLVQDFISGIFLLLENALTVGDAVTLNGTYGVIERLSLRSVHVRANDGSINIFSFSSLSQVTNYNRDFSRAMILATVDIESDTDQVAAILVEIGKEMRHEAPYKDLILADFDLWGVSAIGTSSVSVKGVYPTTNAGRWTVEWEFNRRMKKRFEEHGIQYPREVVDIQGAALERFITNAAPSGETPQPPQH
ncbi:mechanosensitive ion channel family protein [Bombella sp. ESL0385]|uniref:mechanosensitive ion channel family protein n=1 Tax=Bombella sp. ESL0385 TaxID=2676446 RepID=UPI0012D91DDD|nr:mechanosensitive ion channel domain-containing protein [Bombella sp. ESL0385]MUG89527.1 mechanosensitive ion channel [Bombella sp. ESL0385]